MNNRSSVNETNLVNFSAELPTLNQLETKDGLLTFPFDHLYACHSEGSDRRQTLQLDKEVEITTHCVVSEEKPQTDALELAKLRDRLNTFEKQNKALKGLIAYHLDLIQQQNEIVCKTEKLLNSVRQENETLKSRLTRADRRLPTGQRQTLNPPPPPPPTFHIPVNPVPVSTSTVTSKTIKTEPVSAQAPQSPPKSQVMLNSFTEMVVPDNRAQKSYVFESDINKTTTYPNNPYLLPKGTPPEVAYLTDDLSVAKLLSSSLNDKKFSTMIDTSKRPFNVKKDAKPEKRPEPMYTVTSHSGNPVIQRVQRNRRRTVSRLGSMSRMPKPPPKVDTPETSKVFEEEKSFERFSVNKKSKMINTYGKSRCSNSRKTSQFTGSLSDRLRLIDTTPTGEDPYLLGEAEMREQSPIPKLMLQKTNHGRLKVCSETPADSDASMRFYESLIQNDPKEPTKIKLGKYNLTNTYVHPEELRDESPKTIPDESDTDVVKTEPEVNWRTYNMSKPGNETSLCDFSYGETSNNLTANLLPSLDTVEFQNLFSSDSALNLDNLSSDLFSSAPQKTPPEKNKRVGCSSSIIASKTNFPGGRAKNRITLGTKPNRKRALSTTGLMKNLKRENSQKTVGTPKSKPVKTKAPAVSRVPKKAPPPGMSTQTPYHTLCGDPDLSWYLGLDPDVKIEDIDQPSDSKAATVEVPRWREKPYTSSYSLEGTENLDDKVFEKRHQKFEAEERRQLRWHMRRIREQRHMERLRQRHRDSWCGGGSPAATPSVYTVWPQPQRDARFIQITEHLPVMAFGEIVPALPESEFVLPWVRSSKAMKRAKRSKTLY